MKALIAVSSCWRDAQKGLNQVIRDTWVKDLKGVDLDYKIFLGKGNGTPQEDEVVLNVPDDYWGLVEKTRESLRWAIDNGYDYIFRAFVDTFIHPFRLRYVLEHSMADYCGWEFVHEGIHYASGGAGYWLSKAAAKLVLGKPINQDLYIDRYEDLWIGSILQRDKENVFLQHDARFIPDSDLGKCLSSNDIITVHLSRGTGAYNPQSMYDAYTQLHQKTEADFLNDMLAV